MSSSKNASFCTPHLLWPIGLISLVVFISTAFQTTQVFHDRNMLHQMRAQQEKPLEDARRLNAQLTALAQGTLKLAQQGDKNAQIIIDRLKKAGVTVSPPAAADKAPAEHIATPSKP